MNESQQTLNPDRYGFVEQLCRVSNFSRSMPEALAVAPPGGKKSPAPGRNGFQSVLNEKNRRRRTVTSGRHELRQAATASQKQKRYEEDRCFQVTPA
jgi:hypothetical protein